MGKEFQGQRNLARLVSSYTVMLIYSSGMPIMYFIGLIFFTVTFWVNKYLLTNYYTKSDAVFDPRFARSVLWHLRYVIFAKLAMGLFMFCNPHVTHGNDQESFVPLLNVDLYTEFTKWNPGLGDFYKNLEDGQDFLSWESMHAKIYTIFFMGIVALYIAMIILSQLRLYLGVILGKFAANMARNCVLLNVYMAALCTSLAKSIQRCCHRCNKRVRDCCGGAQVQPNDQVDSGTISQEGGSGADVSRQRVQEFDLESSSQYELELSIPSIRGHEKDSYYEGGSEPLDNRSIKSKRPEDIDLRLFGH